LTPSLFIYFLKGNFQKPGSKIIEGFVVPDDSIQFKFTVQIFIEVNQGNAGCGGSLISPNYVLTAAHCVENSTKLTVVQQEPLLKKNTKYEVASVLSHPKFGEDVIYTIYDFAILKLKNSVKKPNFFVCLPNNNVDQFVGADLTISGWGRTNPKIGSKFDVLKSGYLTAMANSDCTERYGVLYNRLIQEEFPGHEKVILPVPQTIICVDGHLTKSSPCSGDSGGKLRSIFQLSQTLNHIVFF